MQKITFVTLIAVVLAVAACDRSSDTSSAGGATDTSSQPSQGSGSSAATRRDADTTARTDADNSARNAQESSPGALTAQDQGGSEADRELTRQIRRALTSNDQLSVNGKNIKVITQNGKVTLRGPVGSPEEQQMIADLVKGVTGVNTVENQLEVKSK